MSNPIKIQLVLHSGDPEGIRIYSNHNSILTTYVVPRDCLAEAKKITDIKNPGIYYLINEESGIIKQIYIGQTREGIKRMVDHDASKDFWNKAILFLGEPKNFTLDVIAGLEKYAIETEIENAAKSNREDMVLNKVLPRYVIKEYDRPDIESKYNEIELMVAVIGCVREQNYCARGQKKKTPGSTNGKPKVNTPKSDDIFKTSHSGISASGRYDSENNKFIVLKDSEINISKDAPNETVNNLRKELLDNGTIVKQQDEKYCLTKDVVCSTPSSAASFVFGGSWNGWIVWKLEDGRTLDDIYRKNNTDIKTKTK